MTVDASQSTLAYQYAKTVSHLSSKLTRQQAAKHTARICAAPLGWTLPVHSSAS